MSTMYIIRGLPGSGKSWLAEAIASFQDNTVICEADDYFYDQNNNYLFDRNQLNQAHQWCQSKAYEALCQAKNVIISNTSTREKEVNTYLNLAKEFGCNVQVIDVQSTFDTVHDVPVEAVEKMRRRFVRKEFQL